MYDVGGGEAVGVVIAAGHTSESGKGGDVVVESSGLAIRKPPRAWVRLISRLIASVGDGGDSAEKAQRRQRWCERFVVCMRGLGVEL